MDGFTLNRSGASDDRTTVREFPDWPTGLEMVSVFASPTVFVRIVGRKVSVGLFTTTLRFVAYVPTRASSSPEPLVRPYTVTVALPKPGMIVALAVLRLNTPGASDESDTERVLPACVNGREILTVRASPTVFVSGTGVNVRTGDSTSMAMLVAYDPTRASMNPAPAVKPYTVTVALMFPAAIVTSPALSPNTSGDSAERLMDRSAPASDGDRLIVNVRASPTVFVIVGVGEKTKVGLLTVTGRFVA